MSYPPPAAYPPANSYPPAAAPGYPAAPAYPVADPNACPPAAAPVYYAPAAVPAGAMPGGPVVAVPSSGQRRPSAKIRCQHCNAVVTTSLRYELGLMVWLVAGGMFLFGLWCCCCIPCCIDSCKDVEHVCPSCHKTVGRFNRLS
eukprot:m51a1_g4914 hypothetical protein (144) ;mRNA; f:209447-210416